MTQNQFERETSYRVAMSIALQMLERNLITAKELRQIDTTFLEKYLPVSGRLLPVSP